MAQWKSVLSAASLTNCLMTHVTQMIGQIENWQNFDSSLLPILQCLAFLLWKCGREVKEEQLAHLFDKIMTITKPKMSKALPHIPPPVQALLCAIFNHPALASVEKLTKQFVDMYEPLLSNEQLSLALVRHDVVKAASSLEPLANVFMSPKVLRLEFRKNLFLHLIFM